jgi:hypothetical protein
MGRTDGHSLEMDSITLDCRGIEAALKPILETGGRSECTVTEAQYVLMIHLFALFPCWADDEAAEAASTPFAAERATKVTAKPKRITFKNLN